MKILLIDHEIYRIQSLARGLRIVGHHVSQAGTLLEALACVRRQGVHIDLIITDCSTQVLCNPELQQAVLERFPDIQVVTMTDKTKWNPSLGAPPWPTHFVDKPFTEVELINLVETMVPTPKSLDSLRGARLGSGSPHIRRSTQECIR